MNKTTIAFLKRVLRRASGKWGPIRKTKQKARRAYKGRNRRIKFEYQCNHCKLYFQNKHVQVDHIIPVGGFHSDADMIGYVERLLCNENGLQVLCVKCHQQKTISDRKR